jgi:hypothetical protein
MMRQVAKIDAVIGHPQKSGDVFRVFRVLSQPVPEKNVSDIFS